MKKCFIVFCSLFFCAINFASVSKNDVQQEKTYHQHIDDATAAFNKMSPSCKYKMLAQLATDLPNDEEKIKLGARILKEAVTIVTKQHEDTQTLSYKTLSEGSVNKLNASLNVITTALGAQHNTRTKAPSTCAKKSIPQKQKNLDLEDGECLIS